MESREQRISKWDRFVVVHENKASLTTLLSRQISQNYRAYPRRGLVVIGEFIDILNVSSSDNTRKDLSGLASSHEEADISIVLHTKDTTVKGYKQLNVLCRDTGVLCPPSGT